MDAYAAPAGDAFRAPKCTPVTLYQSEEKPPAESASSQLAACEGFLAYAIKGGKIRVLARGSATRTLLRGHSQRIVDLAFGGGAAKVELLVVLLLLEPLHIGDDGDGEPPPYARRA